MVKHSRKKQRIGDTTSKLHGALKNAKNSSKRNAKSKSQPLGSKATLEQLLDEENKDDEERRLESMIFDVPYTPREDPRSKLTQIRKDAPGGLVFGIDEEEESEASEGSGRLMGHLLDSDLFVIDDGLGQQPLSERDNVQEFHYENSEKESDIWSGSESSDLSPPALPTPSPPKPTVSTRKSAWTDPSESSTNEISLLSASRSRKLRIAPDEDGITEKEYETRLRQQFERINPEPSWAKRARKKNREERELEDDIEVDEVDEGKADDESAVKNLFASTSGILKSAERRKKKAVLLPSGTLSIERLRDANLVSQNAGVGEIKVVAFHPSEKVPLLCVASADRRVRLYNVDGHTSPLLQTLHVPSLPLTSSTSALFHPSGTSLLLSGPRPFFFTHDLQSGQTTRHERGLWGTTFSLTDNITSVLHPNRKRARSNHDRGSKCDGNGADSVHLTSFSPTGDLLAVAAGHGAQVHLVDWKSGAGQVIGTLRCTGGGSVQGISWFHSRANDPTSSIPLGGADVSMNSTKFGRSHLAVLTSDSEVYLWDVAERRCVKRWKDEGGFRGAGRVLAGTEAGSWLGVGSSSGFVNVYGSDSYSNVDKPPLPIKSIGNLTTAISALKFNHDAQLLAIASKEKKDAMRLVHLPSLAAFANWPTSSTPLGHVTTIDFSARSEYIAIGNTRGRVLLYHLRDYGVGGFQ